MASMEDRFPSSRDALGFPPDRRPPPAASSILDRFHTMLRDLEEDLRESLDADEDPPLPTTAEIVQIYEEVLSQLTSNSKPIITDLTMIAGEQREHAEGIADAICNRILEVSAEQKLSFLYLLDSIVKNIADEYVTYFASRLSKVFCEAYNKLHSSMHPALRHLFGTWSRVFPSPVLRRIEDKLHFSEPDQRPSDLVDMRHSEFPSPRLSHGIHVHPKYEDVQNLRGVSSTSQVYRQKSSTRYGDYDFDRAELQPLRLEMAKVGSPRRVSVRASPMVGVEGSFLNSKDKVSRPSSPPRIGLKRSISPSGDRFRRDVSPGKFVQRSSPSHSGHEYLAGRMGDRMSDQNGWLQNKWPSVDDPQQQEGFHSFNPCNGYSKEHSRDLIDAYGNYRGKGIMHEKHINVKHMDMNGTNSVTATNKWQNSEEEEYVWDDMSPTLADRSNRNSPQPFKPFTGRAGFSRRADGLLESDFRRNNWPDNDPLPPFDDPAVSRIPGIGFGNGSMKMYLDATETHNQSLLHNQKSHHVQDHGKLRYRSLQHMPQSLSPRSERRVLQNPFSTSRNLSIVQKQSFPIDKFPDVEVPFRRLPINHSETLNVDTSTIEKYSAQRPYSPRNSSLLWPTEHRSQPLVEDPIPPNHWQRRSSFDLSESNRPVVHPSLRLQPQQYDVTDRESTISSKQLQLPYPHSGLARVNRQNQEIVGSMQEVPGIYIPPEASQFSSHLVSQTPNPYLSNSLSQLPTSAGICSMPNTSLLTQNGLLPLPPGPPPTSSHAGPTSQNISSITSISSSSPFSGLISTLMAQGLISLPLPVLSQKSVGVEFNADLLKVRHESTINALYSDLPRQCTTCGLRFKSQEEHSNHMDWHVTKNRISKNRKQKPSRRWFVNAKEWLSGAETVGTDATPGFLPTEAVPEKNEDREISVPADEDQTTCALCGEPFEDFYSDETEEWMYKGAVYLNSPNGKIEGLARAQLGPIVHAKCISSESADAIG